MFTFIWHAKTIVIRHVWTSLLYGAIAVDKLSFLPFCQFHRINTTLSTYSTSQYPQHSCFTCTSIHCIPALLWASFSSCHRVGVQALYCLLLFITYFFKYFLFHGSVNAKQRARGTTTEQKPVLEFLLDAPSCGFFIVDYGGDGVYVICFIWVNGNLFEMIHQLY